MAADPSRERVLSALNHEKSDKGPIDLRGNQTGIHKYGSRALRDHLGMDEEIKIMAPVQQLAKPSCVLLKRFDMDKRYVPLGPHDDWGRSGGGK